MLLSAGLGERGTLPNAKSRPESKVSWNAFACFARVRNAFDFLCLLGKSLRWGIMLLLLFVCLFVCLARV